MVTTTALGYNNTNKKQTTTREMNRFQKKRMKPISGAATIISTRNRKQILSQTNHQLCRSTMRRKSSSTTSRNNKRRHSSRSDTSTDWATLCALDDGDGAPQKENQYANANLSQQTTMRKKKTTVRNRKNQSPHHSFSKIRKSSRDSSDYQKKKVIKDKHDLHGCGAAILNSEKEQGDGSKRGEFSKKLTKDTTDTAHASSLEGSLADDYVSVNKEEDDDEGEDNESFDPSRDYDFCFGESFLSGLESSKCSKEDDCHYFGTNHLQEQHHSESDNNLQRSVIVMDQRYYRELESKLRTLYRDACTAPKISNLDQALIAFEEMLNILVDEYGTSHKRVATALQNLSMVHQRAGNLEDALDCIETAIKIRKKMLGRYHLKVAEALAEMGIILMAKEEYEDSLEIMNEALAICERELSYLPEEECGKVKVQIAKILNDFGCVSFKYGEINDAQDAFQQSLCIQKDCYELNGFTSMPGFHATWTTICNQGVVAMASEDFETAIEKLEDALKIQQNVLDSTSVIVMTTMDHLAYAYLQYGGIDKSLEQYQMLVEIIKERGEVNHYHRKLSVTLKNKAYCEMKLFEFDKAIGTLKKLQNTLMEIADDNATHVTRKEQDIQQLIENIRTHQSKVPSLCEFISKRLTKSGYRDPWDTDLLCRCGYDVDDDGNDLNLEIITPKSPFLKTSIYGHKVSFP